MSLRLRRWLTGFSMLAVACPAAAADYAWNNTGGGAYATGASWTNTGTLGTGVVPGAADTANLNLDGSYTVTLSTTQSLLGLALSNALSSNVTFAHTGGTLTLGATGIAVNGGVYFLNGGTISGGTITSSGIGVFRAGTSTASVLNNVVINTAVDFSTANARLRLQGGSQFAAGLTLNLGTGSILGANQAGAINAGALTINMGNNSTISAETASSTLTLAAGATINLAANIAGTVTNNAMGLGSAGTINSAAAFNLNGTGASLLVGNNGTFTNTGSFTGVGGSTLTIGSNGGTFTTTFANTGTINTAGALALSGTNTTNRLLVTGNNAITTSGAPALTLNFANITGGNVTVGAGGWKITGNAGGPTGTAYNTLTNVTLNSAAFDLNTTATWSNLTLAGTTTFGAGSSFNLASPNGSVLGIQQTATLDNFTVNLGAGYFAVEGSNTVTLGSATTLTAASTSTATQVGRNYNTTGAAAALVNQGIIENTSTGTLTINPPGSFANSGTIRATAAGTITLSSSTSAFVNTGTIQLANGSTFNINTPWNISGGTGTFTRTGTNTVNLGGAVTNTGNTLNLDAFGPATLSGSINGGVLASSGTNRLTFPVYNSTANTGTGNLLNNVDIQGNVLNLASATGTNNFNAARLSGTTNFSVPAIVSLASTEGSVLELDRDYPDADRLRNVTVRLANTSIFGITQPGVASPARLITLDTSVVVETASATGEFFGQRHNLAFPATGTADIVNYGIVRAVTSGSTLTINNSGNFTNKAAGVVSAATGTTMTISPGAAFSNEGTINANGTMSIPPTVTNFANSGTININSGGSFAINVTNFNWSNALGIINLNNGGSVSFGGSFTPGAFGTIIRSGTNTLNITGSLFNSFTTRNLDTFGPVVLNGGTFDGGILSSSGTNRMTFQVFNSTGNTGLGNVLSNVDIQGNALNLASASGTNNFNYARLTGTTNFSTSTTVNLGSTEGSVLQIGRDYPDGDRLRNLTVQLANTSIFSVAHPGVASPARLVTLDSSVVVETASATGELFGQHFNLALSATGTADIANYGVIRATASGSNLTVNNSGVLTNKAGGVLQANAGATLTISSGSFVNQGTVVLPNNGTFTVTTPWNTADFGTFSRTGTNRINLNGTVTNTGNTLDLDGTGTLVLNGGTIVGGSITSTGANRLTTSAYASNGLGTLNTLQNVSLGTNVLKLDTSTSDFHYLRFTGTTNFASPGSLVTIAGTTGSVVEFDRDYLDADRLRNVTFQLTNTSVLAIAHPGVASPPRLVTLDSNVTVEATTATAELFGQRINASISATGTADIANYGVIRATASGSNLTVNNSGVLLNKAGGNLQANAGATLTISSGSFVNQGTITLANNGTFTVTTPWNTADFGTFSRTGTNRINLNGTVTNTGNTLDLDGTGTLVLNGGTIVGGSITSTGANRLTTSAYASNGLGTLNTLQNVSLGTNVLKLDTSTSDFHYLRFTGTTNFASPGSLVTIAGTTGSVVEFDRDYLDADRLRNVTFQLTNTSVLAIAHPGVASPPRLVTLDSNVTVEATTATAELFGQRINASISATGTADIANYGVIRATASGSNLTVNNSGVLTNKAGGVLQANAGATLTISSGSFVNQGTVVLPNNGTFTVTTPWNTADFGTFSRTGTNRINLNGTVTNTGNILDLDATGTLTLNGGTIVGGSIASTGANRLTTSTFASLGQGTVNTLQNVSLGQNVLKLDTSTSDFHYLRFTGTTNFANAGSQVTIAGATGSILEFDRDYPDADRLRNVTFQLTNTSVLGIAHPGVASPARLVTLDANVVVEATTASVEVFGQRINASLSATGTADIANYGVIRATASGSNLTVNNSGLLSNKAGGVLQANAGATLTISSGSFVNQGTISLANSSVLVVNAPWNMTGGAGTVSRTGTNTITLNSTATNTGNTLDLASIGSLRFNGSNLLNGSVTTNNDGTLAQAGVNQLRFVSANSSSAPTPEIINNVALGANTLDLTTYGNDVRITGGSTIAGGGVLRFNANNTSNGASLEFAQNYTLANTLVEMGGHSLFGVGGGGFTLTLAPTTTVQFRSDVPAGLPTSIHTSYNSTGAGTIINQGILISNINTSSMNIFGANSFVLTFINQGTLRATNGGAIDVGDGANTIFTSNFTAATNTLAGGTYIAEANSLVNLRNRDIRVLGDGATATTFDVSGTNSRIFLLNAATNPDTRIRLVAANATLRVGGARTYTVNTAGLPGGEANQFTVNGTLETYSGGTISIPDTIAWSNFAANTLTGGTYKAGGSFNIGSRTITTLATGTAVEINASNPFAGLQTLITNNGTLIINNGTLNLSGNLTNSATGTLNVNAGGTLNVAGTFTNNGTYSVAGTMTTNNPGFFNGGTVATTGTINFNSTLNVNAATTFSTGTINVANTTTVNATFTINSGANFGGVGNVVVPASQSLVVNGTTAANKPVTLTGTLTGTGNVGGTVTTAAGATITNGGANLTIGTLAVNGATTLAGSATLLNPSSILSTLTINPGATLGGTAVVSLSGTLTGSGSLAAPLATTSGALLSGSGAGLTVATVNVGGNGTIANNVFAGAVNVNAGTLGIGVSANLGGTGALTTFSGATVVANGTVSKPVTVLSGGTFAGAGVIEGTLNLQTGADLKPGNSPGLLTILDGIVLDGFYEFDLPANVGNGTGAAGTDFDQIVITGGPGTTVVVGQSARVKVRAGGLNASQTLANTSFWRTPNAPVWTIAKGNNAVFTLEESSPGVPGVQALLFDAANNPIDYSSFGSFTFTVDNQGIPHTWNMNWQPVPEPTMILGFAGLMGMVVHGRRNRKPPLSGTADAGEDRL